MHRPPRRSTATSTEPHDVPMTVLGAGLLWFGWFGFNAGSAVAADGLAASAFTVTNIAAAAATITWVLASYAADAQGQRRRRRLRRRRRPRRDHAGVGLRHRRWRAHHRPRRRRPVLQRDAPASPLKVDDALDVFAVHGVGGMFGAIATGIFASSAIQAAYSGLLEGNPQQLVTQLIAVGATVVYAVVGDRSSSSRSSTSCSGSGSSRRPRRWAWTCRSTARPPIRRDAGLLPARRPRSSRPAAVDAHRRRPAPVPPGAQSVTTSDRRRDRSDLTPLYDPRFEHDACGVGFVADAGGRSRDRVLPLALAGLAALAHRGAFGADGESSDGAGVALPLDRSVLELLAGRRRRRGRRGRASSRCFLPRGRAARARAPGRSSSACSPRPACRSSRGATVPIDAAALGAAAAASRPAFAQAIVARPSRGRRRPATRSPTTPSSAGWSSPGGGSRRPPARPAARWPRSSVPSASARTIVYKGLVTGGRLPDLYPDLRAPLRVGYAVFHQRYATNTQPVWRLAQPFRSIAHNGEINTVRGNREQVRGRTGDAAHARGRRRRSWPPARCCPPDGSDSLSLDEGLELLTTTGWDLTPGAADRDPGGARPCAARRIRTSPRCGGGRPGSSRRGTGRPRSSSPTGGGSARSSTATGCGRRPSP